MCQAGFLFLDVHAYRQNTRRVSHARLSDSLNPKPARACSMPLSPTNTNTAKIIRQPVIKRSIFFHTTTCWWTDIDERTARTHERELATSLFSILGGSPSTSIGDPKYVNTLINRKKKGTIQPAS
jgi:hypothetical protein